MIGCHRLPIVVAGECGLGSGTNGDGVVVEGHRASRCKDSIEIEGDGLDRASLHTQVVEFVCGIEILLFNIFATGVIGRRIGGGRSGAGKGTDVVVFDTCAEGCNIDGIVLIDMAGGIDVAGVERVHIAVVPGQRIGGRRDGLKSQRAVVGNSVVLIDVGVAGHKERRHSGTDGIVEARIVGGNLVDPNGNVEIDRS